MCIYIYIYMCIHTLYNTYLYMYICTYVCISPSLSIYIMYMHVCMYIYIHDIHSIIICESSADMGHSRGIAAVARIIRTSSYQEPNNNLSKGVDITKENQVWNNYSNIYICIQKHTCQLLKLIIVRYHMLQVSQISGQASIRPAEGRG